MARDTKDDRWYVQHIGSHTNQVIAGAAERAGVPNVSVDTQEIVYRGKKIQAWEVSNALRKQIDASAQDLGLDVPLVLQQRGRDGKIRKWPFRHKKRLARKTKPVMDRLKKICKEKGREIAPR